MNASTSHPNVLRVIGRHMSGYAPVTLCPCPTCLLQPCRFRMLGPPGCMKGWQRPPAAMALLALLLMVHAAQWGGADGARVTTPAGAAAWPQWEVERSPARGLLQSVATTTTTCPGGLPIPSVNYVDCGGDSSGATSCPRQTSPAFRQCEDPIPSRSRIVCFNNPCNHALRMQFTDGDNIDNGQNGDPCTPGRGLETCVVQWSSSSNQPQAVSPTGSNCQWRSRVIRSCYTARTTTVQGRSNCWIIEAPAAGPRSQLAAISSPAGPATYRTGECTHRLQHQRVILTA
jgi:hypothetical protein